ncbi:MAG: hypothetical protein LUD51_03630 [Clostridia bacterium]|nr:hypothetical protein [Clostridia bacterium]
MAFISVGKTAECVLVAVILAALLTGCSYRIMGVVQSSGFSGKRAFTWFKKKDNHTFGRHGVLFVLCALSSAVIGLCFAFAGTWGGVCSLVPVIAFLILYIWADNTRAVYVLVEKTPRITRVMVIDFVLYAIFCYIAVALLNFGDNVWGNTYFSLLRYVPMSLFVLLLIPVTLLANLVSKAYDVPHGKKYLRAAKEKIAASDIKIIGISGSAGKAVTKSVLHDLLGKKYRVFSTVRAHYTPLGISKALVGVNMSDYDIFIVEMKARYAGDVARLCDILPPDCSITTDICAEHAEAFGTKENMIAANGELLSLTKGLNIIADSCWEDFSSARTEGAKERECCVSGIQCSTEGTTFTLTLGGEAREIHTKLLGEFTAHCIGLAAQMAFSLGLTIDEIADGLATTDCVEHRLQHTDKDGVIVLDDMRASTLTEARSAAGVLATHEGRRIVITGGLSELGVMEPEENRELGASLLCADEIILIGTTLVKDVQKGYHAAGGREENVKIFNTEAKARDYLASIQTAGDCVLYLDVEVE